MTRYHATVDGQIPFTPEEELARDAEEAAWEADSDNRVAAKVRTERNQLLVASDWTQVLDAPVNQAAWATYRQALRDIPQQEGFPETVEWPTQPE